MLSEAPKPGFWSRLSDEKRITLIVSPIIVALVSAATWSTGITFSVSDLKEGQSETRKQIKQFSDEHKMSDDAMYRSLWNKLNKMEESHQRDARNIVRMAEHMHIEVESPQ